MKSLQHSAIPDMNNYINSALPTATNYEEMFIFDLDFEPIEDIGTFKVILKAIQWKISLEFNYTKIDGTTKNVTVHPYRIANFKNYWYLIAYDLLDEKIKTYYLKSITKLHTLYENFISDDNAEKEIEKMCSKINSPWHSGKESKTTLLVRGDARFYIERHLPHHIKIIARHEDYTTMSISYSNETEVLSLVKKWLPDIEIVDNSPLSKKLDQSISAYINRKK